MADDKSKKALDIVLAFGGKPKQGDALGAPADDEDAEGEHDDMALTTAMEEFISAVKAGDAKAAAMAFRSAQDLC